MAAKDLKTSDDPEVLLELAGQCRKLASGASTADVRRCFQEIASVYERKAASREKVAGPAPLPPNAAR